MAFENLIKKDTNLVFQVGDEMGDSVKRSRDEGKARKNERKTSLVVSFVDWNDVSSVISGASLRLITELERDGTLRALVPSYINYELLPCHSTFYREMRQQTEKYCNCQRKKQPKCMQASEQASSDLCE